MDEQQGDNHQGRQHQRMEHHGAEHHHHQYYHPHMQQAPSAMYGYPMDPAWGIASANASAAYMQAMYGYQYPLQHMEGVPLPPGIPGLGGSTDPLEAVLGPFPCVRLRNLPYDTSLEDILIFFQGLVLIDVVLVGQGDAFVIFANPMDFQMALQRNRQTIGRRFVDISPSSRADYYEAIAAQHEQERGPKLRASGGGVMSSSGTGIPMRGDGSVAVGDEPQSSGESAAASSVAALWSSSPETAVTSHTLQSLSGGHVSSGGPTASTTFEGSLAQHHPSATAAGIIPLAGSAVGSSGSASAGGRVGPGSSARTGGGLHAPLQKRTGGGIQVGEHTGFLRMRGLPFSASKDDIIKFFTGYNPIPDSIVLTYRNDGRATGEAYVGFASPDDSKRAMELHRRMMGNRYIELFISNKDEQGRALARFGSR